MTAARRRFAETGISLLVFALAITAIGITLAVYLHWLQIEMEKERIETTRARLTAVHIALTRYAILNDRYPCPENPIPRRDAPSRFDDTGKTDEDCAPDDPNHTNSAKNPIWFGVVPLRALHLEATAGLDGWGNKITYAVTHYLTAGKPLKYMKPPWGVLRVHDQNGTNVLTVQDKGRYVLISHGPTGAGAWTPEGVRRPCASGTMDSLNCSGGYSFIQAPFTTKPGPGFYDDIVLTEDTKDRTIEERIAVCNDREAFYSPGDGAADPEGCITRTNIWKGGCTSTLSPTAAGKTNVIMPPSLPGCVCDHDLTVFSSGTWDDSAAAAPGGSASSGALLSNTGSASAPGTGVCTKIVNGVPVSVPGITCQGNFVPPRTTLSACTKK